MFQFNNALTPESDFISMDVQDEYLDNIKQEIYSELTKGLDDLLGQNVIFNTTDYFLKDGPYLIQLLLNEEVIKIFGGDGVICFTHNQLIKCYEYLIMDLMDGYLDQPISEAIHMSEARLPDADELMEPETTNYGISIS